ncbi:hypothetical protein PDJAM_G00040810 [Pangasius djambal]|uniref:Uncharacterized protein n=1 Tax=Pangasius djambal TaxID=1691987 RepID=A0ACC5YV35_9TELE|nr:hypothetical protein [Pangasius djambal]
MIPTEDASARKREIEEKLKQEQETLSFIRENLEKSDQLTKGMVSILSSFESRLMALENSIIPVHKQTENLQRLQENVDRTLFCLDHEQETLSFIRENLEKSDQLTKGMVSILSSFESRLMALENSIIPVHKQTENLQRLQENVDRTLFCLDHVISYYHVAKDTDKIIKEGPVTLELIQFLLHVFQKVRFEKGKEQLEAEFRALLTRYSKPVPPVLILDAIGGDEELEGEVTLEHLPEAVLQDVICIAGWLVEYGRNQDFMNVYFQIRSSQLDRSIKGLKEHFRKNSASSALLYSPAVQTKRKDTPTKKVPKRPVYIPGTIRKAQNLLKQYSQHGLDGKKASNLTPLEGYDHEPRGVKHLSDALSDKHGASTDKERQVIKDKFKGFNDGLEELCKIQKVWAIPDKEQRDAIRHAQKKLISDAYKAFLHRCANMPFTKNPEKYHKYTPELVEAMIDKLFDTSA